MEALLPELIKVSPFVGLLAVISITLWKRVDKVNNENLQLTKDMVTDLKADLKETRRIQDEERKVFAIAVGNFDKTVNSFDNLVNDFRDVRKSVSAIKSDVDYIKEKVK